jgi:hypothetical protein
MFATSYVRPEDSPHLSIIPEDIRKDVEDDDNEEAKITYVDFEDNENISEDGGVQADVPNYLDIVKSGNMTHLFEITWHEGKPLLSTHAIDELSLEKAQELKARYLEQIQSDSEDLPDMGHINTLNTLSLTSSIILSGGAALLFYMFRNVIKGTPVERRVALNVRDTPLPGNKKLWKACGALTGAAALMLISLPVIGISYLIYKMKNNYDFGYQVIEYHKRLVAALDKRIVELTAASTPIASV